MFDGGREELTTTWSGAGLSRGRVEPRAGVGIVGCGVIAPAYARQLAALGTVELVACVDGIPERAERARREVRHPRRARRPRSCSPTPSVDIVAEPHAPQAHATVDARRARGRAGRSSARSRSRSSFADGRGAGRAGDRTRPPTRLRARHVPGCGPADLPDADRRRRRSASRSRQRVLPVARPGVLAPATASSSTSAAPARSSTWRPYYLTALVQLLGPARRDHRLGAHHACAARDHEPAARGDDHGRRGARPTWRA